MNYSLLHYNARIYKYSEFDVRDLHNSLIESKNIQKLSKTIIYKRVLRRDKNHAARAAYSVNSYVKQSIMNSWAKCVSTNKRPDLATRVSILLQA